MNNDNNGIVAVASVIRDSELVIGYFKSRDIVMSVCVCGCVCDNEKPYQASKNDDNDDNDDNNDNNNNRRFLFCFFFFIFFLSMHYEIKKKLQTVNSY